MSVNTMGNLRCSTVLPLLALCFLCLSVPAFAVEKKEYRIVIAFDTVLPYSEGIMDGFRTTLDSQLALSGAVARYHVFDTKLDEATIPSILSAIEEVRPDLVCTVNYPSAFADMHITAVLKDSGFKIISENTIPVQSGIIKSWQKPGGNVTGVGVFLKFNAQIKLMRMINPKASKLVLVSWDAMTELNEWFEIEVVKACREEGIEFFEFRRVASIEEEVACYAEYDTKGSEYFILNGISAFIQEDGGSGDVGVIFTDSMKSLKHLQFISYDENPIRMGALAGACVVWYDIGAQMAEKGMKILNGANPGDLAWEYPRKSNIMLNLQTARNRGINFPQSLTGAAYRAYTDYEGNFLGNKN
jgi:putative ABC transport system substrate-binding protein